MRITILLIFLFTFSSVLINAQIDEFDLQDFEMPFFSNQQMRANFSFNGTHNYGQVRDTTSLFNDDTYRFSGSFAPRYFINKNAEKYQQNTSVGLVVNPYKNKEIYFSTERISASLFATSTHRFFYKGERYFQVGGSWSSNYSYNQQIRDGVESKFSNWNHRLQAPLKWGVGRIHNVTDVWRSIRMLKNMEKQGLLSGTPSQEDVQALGDLATNRNQVTFFDARLKRIEDYELLDQWFQSSGLVPDRNIAYFNALQDNWLFGANAQRQKGKSISIGVTPFLNSFPRIFNPTPSNFSEFQGIWGDLSFEWYKPITQNLQLDLQVGIGAGPTWVHYFFFGNQYEGITGAPSIQTRLAFFPTTRTGFETNLRMHYHFNENPISQNNFNEVFFNWSNDAYIYFSPQTRLNFNFSLQNGAQFINDSNLDGELEFLDSKVSSAYNLSFLYYFF